MALGPAHTNAFSFKNAYNSTRLGLPSALIRWAFSSKTHRFENAFETKWIKTEMHTYHISVDGRRRIAWKGWPKISQARTFVACAKSSTYVTTSDSIPFCGQSRSHENVSVDTNRSMRFRWQRKCISVDTAATNKVGTSTVVNWREQYFRKIFINSAMSMIAICDSHDYNIILYTYQNSLGTLSKTAQNVKHPLAKSKDTLKIVVSKT